MWPEGPPPAVKVCGLTVAAEAEACAALGVWGVGVVLAAGSPRRVDVATAAAVLAGVPRTVARVGVFVNATPAEMAAAARVIGLTHLQIHGGTDPAEAREASGLPVIQGVRMDGPEALERARASAADLVMLDAAVPGKNGGTGVAFDWSLLDDAALGRPFALAGGCAPRTWPRRWPGCGRCWWTCRAGWNRRRDGRTPSACGRSSRPSRRRVA